MRRSVPYRIKIEAERSYSTRGDIAIDDISFQGCALPGPASTCYAFRCAKSQACVASTRQCDFTDDCGDGTDEANCPYPQISRRFVVLNLHKYIDTCWLQTGLRSSLRSQTAHTNTCKCIRIHANAYECIRVHTNT